MEHPLCKVQCLTYIRIPLVKSKFVSIVKFGSTKIVPFTQELIYVLSHLLGPHCTLPMGFA